MKAEKRYLPDAQVAKRYGVSNMTIWRWDRNPALGFPRPIRINNRKYRDEDELDDFDRRRAADRTVPVVAGAEAA